MSFKPGTGKMLIRFKKELIDRYELEKPRDLSWGRIILFAEKDFDLTVQVSVEIAQVESVVRGQKFFQPGDTVILNYLVFSAGRFAVYKDNFGKRRWMQKFPERRVHTLENGDELFYAYDGSNNWDQTEIYGKITPEGIMPAPGLIMINPPKTVEKVGLIIMPEDTKEDRDESFFAEVLAIHPLDAEELQIEKGDEIICSGGLAYEIRASKELSYYFIRAPYVLAKTNAETV